MQYPPRTDGVLFHYTTLDALYGIVENRAVWASHVYYLNDSNEIRTAAEEALAVLDANQERENPTKVKSFMFELMNWLVQLRDLPHYVFIFSVSEHSNLLSQWRAYTRHGSGVSIGFLKEDLDRLAIANQMKLVKCIYDLLPRQEILLKILVETIDEYFKANPAIADDTVLEASNLSSYFEARTESFLQCFCSIKDPAFREEGEWRLISKHYPAYTDPRVKFRPGRTTLIPYIEVPIGESRPDGYLFEQVYPGTSPNFHLSYQATVAYLSNKHACRLIINPQSPWTER